MFILLFRFAETFKLKIMKFNLIRQESDVVVEITDMEGVVGSELVISERSDKTLDRYYAKFEHSDTREGPVLVGSYGNGNTMDEAILDYAKEISGKTLVIDAYSKSRREYKMPTLKHTKLLNR